VWGKATPLLLVRGGGKKGEKVQCEFCGQKARGLINLRVYTRKGIQVCEECYEDIDKHRHKPYSKVMDKLAMVEAGYHVNRKLARR
jgi:ribosome-binding protein aMBF1 (putative translation factor)